MKRDDFFFELPQNLVAQFPPQERGQSRLMVLNRKTGKNSHRMVGDLPQILLADEFRGKDGELPLFVFNNSKVRKARLIGKSCASEAEVEFLLLESVLGENGKVWKTIANRAKRRKPGSSYAFFDATGTEIARAEITEAEGEFRFLRFDRAVDDKFLEQHGHIPLPPYIRRNDEDTDAKRYQTVYAKETGSAAAPTAGLHFTQELLNKLADNGIESVFITLHVGLGTFLPVRCENIEDHVMHSETFSIDEDSATKIENAKKAGRKIIAAGTTSVRTLESAWNCADEKLKRGENKTSIFIYPGYDFKVVDALFTNFHTPESTLLMLVCAFAGKEMILESYAEAVRESYRFFSYGDAMLIY